MEHNIRITGLAYSLRPVQITDADFIFEIRSSNSERLQYLHSIGSSVDEQRDWIEAYLERDNDYYWIIERNGTKNREGLISIYNLDDTSAEWGRWILLPKSLGAIESALLIYRVAFEHFKLRSLYCITVSENKPVVSFHDSCGLPRVKVLKGQFSLQKGVFNGVMHECHLSGYPSLLKLLTPKVEMVSNLLSRTK